MLTPLYPQELRLSSNLMSEFSSESSPMTTDGALSTAWLKNMNTTLDTPIFSEENGSGTRMSTSSFFAQPSSVPGSVLQLVGSSYLLRATAWEMYGR